ncbi:hypothetical protein EYV94_09190 [Puteibacter caeruleilacunae]|nr:hypothetical protein EYV94_09190 [Puteibacter caeruleilacunae]
MIMKIYSVILFVLFSVWNCSAKQSVQLISHEHPLKIVSDTSEVFKILDKSNSLKNAILEFDMTPLNSHGHVGALLRYSSPDSWIYLGCDMSDDLFGRAVWFVTTPDTTVVFSKDINKPFKNLKRNVRIKYLENTLTLWIEGEEVMHGIFPCNVTHDAGKVGFRAWNGGGAVIENIKYEQCTPLVAENASNHTFTIASNMMEVNLDETFPRIVSYHWLENQAQLYGQPTAFNYISINGKDYKPTVQIENKNKRSVDYILRVKEVGITITLNVFVEKNVLNLRTSNIEENGDLKVHTLGFPQNSLVSVSQEQDKASLSVTKYSEEYSNNNIRNTGITEEEFFISLKNRQTDPTNFSAGYVFLNTNKLAATVDNNVTQNFRQFRYQTTNHDGINYTGIWNQDWIYRGFDGNITELPWAKVLVTNDRNNDTEIDWQDGAIALRENMPELLGAEKLRSSFSHIGKIEGSMTQFTFLRWLDYLKKINLLTDNFGQIFLIKGYQSEGHDSAHPDYGGNYNERAGGYHDLKVLLNKAKKYNTELCLHINHSESYPEAKSFNETIVSDIPAWCWWDQSFFIIRKTDILNGTFQKRINELHEQLPGLNFVYVDTYREERWIADYTAKLLENKGWAIYTEEAMIFDRYSSWVHYSPGGKSKISRFIHHQNKDAYQFNPLLLGGYDSRKYDMITDTRHLLDNFMTQQLPYRYLMNFPLMKWTDSKALFSDHVISQLENDKTVIRKNGKAVAVGSDVFIPWNPKTETKIYCYYHLGENQTWELPDSWQNRKEVFLYELTDLGRKFDRSIRVLNGKITLDLKNKTPYVLYRRKTDENMDVEWGEGSLVKDMGFDSKSFNVWTPVSLKNSESHVKIRTSDNGNAYLCIEGTDEAVVEQQINGLEGGRTYMASVWAEVSGDKKAVLSVTPENGGKRVNYMLEEGVSCTVPSQKWGNWQKMRVTFNIPVDCHSAVIRLKTGRGSANSFVHFDDVRIIPFDGKIVESNKFFEDFENVDEGVFPFIPAHGGTKIHLSEKHKGYTKDVINGEFSLKVSEGNGNGLIAQTLPCNLRFLPNTSYTLSFSYLTNIPESYRLMIKSRKGGDNTVLIEELLGKGGEFKATFTTGKEYDYYLSIYKEGKSELILDDIMLELKSKQ